MITIVAQSRRNSESSCWQTVDHMSERDVERQNAECGWRKYRLARRVLNVNDQAALLVLATEGRGRATTGDEPGALHVSWRQHLDRLAQTELVDAFSEHGSLATDPGRTFYEITEQGLDVLAAIRERHAAECCDCR